MRTRTRTILAGLVLAAALVGGVAWATGPISSVVAADGTINGCYRATNGDDDNGGKGQLRVVAAGESCKKNERSITWSQKGVKGEPGAAGANGLAGRDGAPGAKGETGAAGADGTNGTNGTDGSDGAQGAKGDPCLATDPACVGPKGETGAAGRDGVDGAPGAVGPTGPPGSGSGSLASLDALGGTSCNAAGNPGTVVVSYGPPPVGAITLACKPTANGTVLVSKIGAGSGTVTSNIGGIDCGTTCVRTFTTGTVVTLTATAASGDDFVGWLGGGGCSGTGTCTVTATGLVTVSAHFEPHVPTSLLYLVYTKRDSTDTVEVTPTAAATNCDFGGDPRDPSVTTFFCGLTFLAGTTVTLRAGNSRVVWSGACAGTTGVTCTLTLDADKSVGATFPEF